MEDFRRFWGEGCPEVRRVKGGTYVYYEASSGHQGFNNGGGPGNIRPIYGNGYLISGNEVEGRKYVDNSGDRNYGFVSPSFYLFA